MLTCPTSSYRTPPAVNPRPFDVDNMRHALLQGQLGLREGGVPIGSALVTAEGVVIGCGRNRRVQLGSPTRHGEMDCLENIGRLAASVYKDCTLFSTLSPCTMCTGAIILFGIRRVVLGENTTFLGTFLDDDA